MSIYNNKTIECQILSNLLFNDDYRNKVLPFLNDECFQEPAYRWTFHLIDQHLKKYTNAPIVETLLIDLEALKIHQTEHDNAEKYISSLTPPIPVNMDWLVDATEKFCQDRAIYNAIYKTINILDDQKQPRSTIRELIDEALTISFKEDDYLVDVNTLINSYVPPDYLIEPLFKRGYLYALTGGTGAGKTAIALALGLDVARTIGRVVYFAGENPDDTTARLTAMIPDDEHVNMKVVNRAGRAAADIAIAKLRHSKEPIALVIVDTSTAYFFGDNENDNLQALSHAKWLRSISSRVPGNPTVLVCCHPVKNADENNLVPRGGSSFLCEVDGNLRCVKKGSLSVLYKDPDKFRGVDFDPIAYIRSLVYSPKLKMTNGDIMPTVVARLANDEEVAQEQLQTNDENMSVLNVLAKEPGSSLRDIAKKLLWTTKNNNLDPKKVSRVLARLEKLKLIDASNHLTALGEEMTEEEPVRPKTGLPFGGNGRADQMGY